MLQGHLPNVAQFLQSSPPGQAEVEIRFGSYDTYGRFSANVPYIYYERLQNRLQLIPLESTTIMSTVEIDAQGQRRINIGTETLFEQKIRHQIIDVPEYNMRLSLATESPVQEILQFQPQIVRDRIRKSYHYNDFIRIDCTEVCSTRDQSTKITYEVEIEFLGTPNQLEAFNQEVEVIYKYYRGTSNLYTQSQVHTLLLRVNQVLGSSSDRFDRRQLVNARNLHRRDMVYGGIVGNQSTQYVVTYKADGYRKLLVIHSDGIWLIYPPYEYNLVIIPNTVIEKLLITLNGIILDGELVQSKNKDFSAYYFLAFDILTSINTRTQSIVDVRPYPYISNTDNSRQRLTTKIVEILSRSIGADPLTVEVKPASILSDVPTYFRQVRYYLEQRSQLAYPEDGLIFFPANTPYNITSENLPLQKRVLTQVPDICKWKPGFKTTNDFAVRWLPSNQIQLMVYDPENKSMIPFEGTAINPLDPSIIDISSPLLYSQCGPISTDTVVEFEYDSKVPILRPIRIRYDKSGPNKLDIAKDNWDMSINPISEDELAGISLKMAFTYHNQIKRKLFQIPGSNKTLLDIGSGRGGDLSKWFNYQKVVAVEPNAANVEELRLRLSRMPKLASKVLVVQAGGQDTEIITQAVQNFIGGQVDVVSSMLSLSFFWQSYEMLQALVQTIRQNLKPDGLFLFLTIDGQSLDYLFKKNNTKVLDIGPATFTMVHRDDQAYGQIVDVVLPDTIVEDQREYLVFLPSLNNLGLELSNITPAIGEKLLSESNMLFSSLYSYGQGKLADSFSRLSLKDGPVTESQPTLDLGDQVVAAPEVPKIPGLRIMPIQPGVNFLPVPPPACNIGVTNVLSVLPYRDGVEGYVKIETTWYNNLVRIATIGDNNCFIHGLLSGFAHNYQALTNMKERSKMAAELRRDLALKLGTLDSVYTKYVVWEVTARGQYINLLISQLQDSTLVWDLQVDYSLQGLQYLLNSQAHLGEEFVDLCSRLLHVNIYLLRAGQNDLHVHVQTHPIVPENPHVVLIGGGCHWEVLGLEENNTITTSFSQNSDFIQVLQARFNNCQPNNDTPYDPKANYFKLFRELDYTPTFLQNLSQLKNNEPLIQRLIRLNIIALNANNIYERTSLDLSQLI